jgi:hypothetical protein
MTRGLGEWGCCKYRRIWSEIGDEVSPRLDDCVHGRHIFLDVFITLLGGHLDGMDAERCVRGCKWPSIMHHRPGWSTHHPQPHAEHLNYASHHYHLSKVRAVVLLPTASAGLLPLQTLPLPPISSSPLPLLCHCRISKTKFGGKQEPLFDF